MSRKSPTPILLDTAVLSTIVSDILAHLCLDQALKSACLNKAAARIAGPKHNWGFLTGQTGPVTAIGVKAAQSKPSKAPSDEPVADDQEQLPPHILEGARLALQASSEAPGSLLEAKELFLALAYKSAIPHAAEVFTTAQQVKNDLVHNRGHLIRDITALVEGMEQENQDHLAPLASLWAQYRSLDEDAPEGNSAAVEPRQREATQNKAKQDWADLLKQTIEQKSPATPGFSKPDFTKPESTKPGLPRGTRNLIARYSAILDDLPNAALSEEQMLEIPEVDLPQFVEFLRSRDTHPSFITFIEQNPYMVHATMLTGQITPRVWGDAAESITAAHKGPEGLEAFHVMVGHHFSPVLTQMLLKSCGLERKD